MAQKLSAKIVFVVLVLCFLIPDERGRGLMVDARDCSVAYDEPLCQKKGIGVCTKCRPFPHLTGVRCNTTSFPFKCVCIYTCQQPPNDVTGGGKIGPSGQL
ncbi:hypothetical protein C2S52_012765 [Perilla frutescens var. hirtella]|nr:hypothetical protein C2S51_015139 [Perilla frutescens var. frutescens]KAH6775204.1 hypothetical protein C2S52_012765 [Perilla frutescens var. hirtella]